MEFKTVFQHEGQEIGVTGHGTFQAPDEQSFQTLEEAKAYVHQQGLEERAAVALNREVMTAKGDRLTVRRIHSGHGKWLTQPSLGALSNYGSSSLTVYRPGEAVTELLAAKAKLDAEVKVIQDQLDERKFQLSPAHFRRGDTSESVALKHQAFLDWYNSQAS